MKKFCDSMI